MNLLMICVDDLRPLLACYGHPEMHTPNLDRLAAGGVRFGKAYCQVPVCGASRASLLTGLLPTRDRFISFECRADQEAPGATTLLHLLKQNGYTLVGNNKVFHDLNDHAALWDKFLASDLPAFPGPYHDPHSLQRAEEGMRTRPADAPPWVKGGLAWECADVADEAQHDGMYARKAVVELRRLAREGRPFCLAYGSTNVHLPFKAPKRYWDLYDPATLPLPDHPRTPNDVPAAALPNWQELRNYVDVVESGPLDDQTARTLIHAYRAGVSYLDAQVGLLLDELDRLNLAESTLVLLWADHGFNLGEHGVWCKHCLYETSLQVPLIMRPPTSCGFTPGTVVNTVVENTDVFPTLCELLGLKPTAPLHGRSLVPLMQNPVAAEPGRAYSRFFDGESIRTDRYRYAEWRHRSGERYARVLFDLTTDPGETHNLAENPSNSKILREMELLLNQRNKTSGVES